MQEYVAMWKNYVNFKERSTVRSYWTVILINLAISFVLGLLGGLLGIFSVVAYLYTLATFIPGLALCIRRFHDINKSGWWIFISCVPIVGWIMILIWLCKASVDVDNQYGSIQV